MVSYKPTVTACYVGNFTQAIVINLTAILYIPLRELYGVTYSQFGLLVLINFFTQVIVDILCSKPVDKYGFKPFVVTAHILCVFGFICFATAPLLFKGSVFTGFVIATVIFSASGGLLELLLSPIVDAIPTKEKDKAMAMLHSFYAWGQVTVVLVTTVLLFLRVQWYIIVLLWAIVPLINTYLFSKAPIASKLHESQIMKIKSLIVNPIFITAFFAMIFAAASELVMSQWSSSFMEKGLALPKLAGDLLGMCGFALMLGIGRLIYGIIGSKLDLNKLLVYGSLVTVGCYITVAISPFPWLSVLACVVTGICVSLLWPGTLVITSAKLPLAGASMFALLAAGGDIGASVGPWLTGVITDFSIPRFDSSLIFTPEQLGLRTGIACATIFPLMSFVCQYILKRSCKK